MSTRECFEALKAHADVLLVVKSYNSERLEFVLNKKKHHIILVSSADHRCNTTEFGVINVHGFVLLRSGRTLSRVVEGDFGLFKGSGRFGDP